MNDRYVCTLEVSPDEVDAGADVTLTVCVEDTGHDVSKRPGISIRNRDNTELARAELTESEEGGYEADDIVLSAPRAVGEHVYQAVVVAADQDGVSQDLATTEVRFAVKAHEAQLNVWDMPPTLVPGERFKFTVGVRCSAGCNLAGRDLSIVDRDGTQIARAALGPAVWPGTDALYFAEIEVAAPPGVGSHQWEARTAAWTSDLPHDPGSLAVGLKIVRPPNCEVTIEAIDREKQIPIRGARVVMHPYRATTGENGKAQLRVADGRYDVLVSASKYAPVSMVVEVTGDIMTKAELDEEPPLESPDE